MPSKLFYGLAYSSAAEGDVKLKEWECTKVQKHKDIGKTIDEWQKNGWCLHTYQAIGTSGNPSHYLLFKREATS